jgi:hypothetical protein
MEPARAPCFTLMSTTNALEQHAAGAQGVDSQCRYLPLLSVDRQRCAEREMAYQRLSHLHRGEATSGSRSPIMWI